MVRNTRGVKVCPLCKGGPFAVRKGGKLEGHKCSHDQVCKPCDIEGAADDVPNCVKCHFQRHQEAVGS